jgi:hypothetical protein
MSKSEYHLMKLVVTQPDFNLILARFDPVKSMSNGEGAAKANHFLKDMKSISNSETKANLKVRLKLW